MSSDGTIIAIGGYLNDGNGVNSGHVRVFENINNTWIQLGSDIDGESEGDYSGRKISLNNNGNIIAIGAGLNDGNGTESGHARIYNFREITTINGCDNAAILNLTINNSDTSITEVTACESYAWNDSLYTQSRNLLFKYTFK